MQAARHDDDDIYIYIFIFIYISWNIIDIFVYIFFVDPFICSASRICTGKSTYSRSTTY